MRHVNCNGGIRTLCSIKECKWCFDKSFESSEELVSWWSDENEKRPREVFKSSHAKYKFTCKNEECGHPFDAALHKITNSGTRCPYCCNSRKICEDKECKLCLRASFASSHRAKHWSPKNKGTPRDYMKAAHRKFLFDCPTCKHEFSTTLGHVTTNNRWCPYCAVPSKKLCEDSTATGCKFCHQRTFGAINPKLVKYWSDKNPKTPWQLPAFSHTKCTFVCKEHGDFAMKLYSITEGRWCSLCVRKTEAKLFEWLKENYPGKVKREAKFDWCRNRKTGRHLPFDFCFEEEKILIELDGAQHFRQVYNWAPPEATQIRDRYKERKANENGYTVIRLLQEDVLYEKACKEWRILLKKSINRPRNNPEVVYIEDDVEKIVTYEMELVFG